MDIIKDFIATGRRNRPGYRMVPEYITIHDTANSNPGANARAHAKYLHGDAAAGRPASWHFTVDDQVIIQHLPLDENGWHAGDGGDGPGNRTSIGIEICENIDGDRTKAEKNAAWLVAYLLQELNLGVEKVVQHHHWTGKNCPHVLRSRPGGWESFLAEIENHLPVKGTPILGPPHAIIQQAQAWAKSRGAHQRFIDIAPTYWELGQKIGIRPEVAYAQSAQETAFGHYGGAVRPEQNNWAGIKTRDASGDRPEDHESFTTPKDGVRAHLNHLAAYVGVEPIGEPHGRYYLVKSLSWAGSVRHVEELGGRWAPNPDYGRSIVQDYLAPLLATKVPGKPQEPSEVEELRARVAELEKQVEALQTDNLEMLNKLRNIAVASAPYMVK